jgi:hypothetical protein
MMAALERTISWKVHFLVNQTCWKIGSTTFNAGGVSRRRFPGLVGVVLLTLEVDEARLVREEDERVERFEMPELLLLSSWRK